MNAKRAKKILPKGEFESFESVFQNQIRNASPARLKKKATLSRRLRDKYRDLARRQVVAAKSRRTNQMDVRLNESRSQLFQEVIDRIEHALEKERPERPKRLTARHGKIQNARRRERETKKLLTEAKRPH